MKTICRECRRKSYDGPLCRFCAGGITQAVDQARKLSTIDKVNVYLEVERRVQATAAEGGMGDLSGLCLYWSLHTVEVIREHGIRAILQAGSAMWPMIRPEDDDGVRDTHFSYLWEPDSQASRAALLEDQLPEMHIWAAIPTEDVIVDMTTQFWPEQAEKLAGLDWPGDKPPKMFWGKTRELRGACYHPSVEASILALRILARLYGEGRATKLVD